MFPHTPHVENVVLLRKEINLEIKIENKMKKTIIMALMAAASVSASAQQKQTIECTIMVEQREIVGVWNDPVSVQRTERC